MSCAVRRSVCQMRLSPSWSRSTAFARALGVSLPYLNQMENNNRPVSTTVVLALAQEFGFDVTELQSGDEALLVSDMREALADPVFTGPAPALADMRLMPKPREISEPAD